MNPCHKPQCVSRLWVAGCYIAASLLPYEIRFNFVYYYYFFHFYKFKKQSVYFFLKLKPHLSIQQCQLSSNPQPTTLYFIKHSKKTTNVERFRAQIFTHHKNCKKTYKSKQQPFIPSSNLIYALVYFIKITIFCGNNETMFSCIIHKVKLHANIESMIIFVHEFLNMKIMVTNESMKIRNKIEHMQFWGQEFYP